MARTTSSQLLKAGEKAPDFRLKGVDNNVYSMKDFRSKAVLVVFICNHCPYVKARIRDIVSLQKSFSSEQLQVVGINSNDTTYDGEGFDNMIFFLNGYIFVCLLYYISVFDIKDVFVFEMKNLIDENEFLYE